MSHALKLRNHLLQKYRLLLIRFGTVEQVFICRSIEQDTQQWQGQTRYLEPFSIMGPQDTRPETHLRILSQRGVRHLEHNPKHILVQKVIRARKCEIIAKAHQVKKEGIAATTGEEGIITSI